MTATTELTTINGIESFDGNQVPDEQDERIAGCKPQLPAGRVAWRGVEHTGIDPVVDRMNPGRMCAEHPDLVRQMAADRDDSVRACERLDRPTPPRSGRGGAVGCGWNSGTRC